jgi:hypothetical protein
MGLRVAGVILTLMRLARLLGSFLLGGLLYFKTSLGTDITTIPIYRVHESLEDISKILNSIYLYKLRPHHEGHLVPGFIDLPPANSGIFYCWCAPC